MQQELADLSVNSPSAFLPKKSTKPTAKIFPSNPNSVIQVYDEEKDYFIGNKSQDAIIDNQPPVSWIEKLKGCLKVWLKLPTFGKGVNDKANKLNRHFMLRVRIRYLSLFLFTAALILICCGFYFGIRHTDTLIYKKAEIRYVNIDLKNCMLVVEDYDDPVNILVKYMYYYKIDPFINPEVTQTSAKFSLSQSTLNIKVYSELSDIECKIQILAHKSFDPLQFKLNCQPYSTCLMIQESEQFSAQEMTIQNGNIYANFKNLVVNSFNFQTTKGNLQLHRFNIGFAKIELTYGDIFLQNSDQDLSVNWQNQQQAFCFSAPFITHSTIQDCYIAEQSNI